MNGVFSRLDGAIKARHLYVFPLLIIIVIAYLFFARYTVSELQVEKLEEKLVETNRAVNVIANHVRYEVTTRDDWDTYDYDSEVSNDIFQLDDDNTIFACAYRGYDLELVSEQHPKYDGTSEFDPLAYPDFVTTVKEKFGTMGVYPYTVWYEDEQGSRDIHLRYRWVPVLDYVDDPYLIVIGVSELSVATGVATGITLGNIVFGAYIVGLSVLFAGLYVTVRKGKHED